MKTVIEMIKKCVVCGAEFYAPPSSKKITCSSACSRKRKSEVLKGHTISEETKNKISEKAKRQDRTEILSKGNQASQKSPKSGRFDTNVSAKDWILISPEGIRYECHSMINFVRKNPELFGINGDDESVNRCAAGIRAIKGNILHGRRGHTYHGWTVIVK